MNCLQIQGGPAATGQAPWVLYVTRAQLCTQPEEASGETAGLRIRTILERKSSAVARVFLGLIRCRVGKQFCSHCSLKNPSFPTEVRAACENGPVTIWWKLFFLVNLFTFN